jgi:hypothetical protein
MSARVLRKGLPVALAVASLALVDTAPAVATTPWWHLNVYSAPANKLASSICVYPSPAAVCEEGTVTVNATNLGDTLVNAQAHPVTIVDTLPAGVTVTETSGKPNISGMSEVFTEFSGGELHNRSAPMSCTLAAQTVTCTYAGGPEHLPLPAYEALTIAINVQVAKGAGTGLNQALVEGGGAATVTSEKALALTDTTPPFGLETYELTPEEEGGVPDTLAGSHPFQLTTTIALNAQTNAVKEVIFGKTVTTPQVHTVGPFVKDLRFNLPPGLVGNPVPLPKCTSQVVVEESQGRNKCPQKAAVGMASIVIANASIPETPFLIEPLWSVEPAPGEPARFAFQSVGAPVFLDTSVRTGSDYGVVVSVHQITQTAEFVRAQVTFWGIPAAAAHNATRGECLAHLVSKTEIACLPEAEEKPFLIMPTSCPSNPLATSVEADSWGQPGQFTAPKEYSFHDVEGAPLLEAGCAGLNFKPEIEVKSDGEQASTPTGLGVDVHVPQDASLDPKGRAESSVKETTVTLPAGVTLNPAGADGLDACSDALIGYLPEQSSPPEVLSFTPTLPGSPAAIGAGETKPLSPGVNFCPDASKVGTVEIKTPLLPNKLVGAVYLAEQNANPFGSLVALYIVAEDRVSGVLVKVAGAVEPQEGSGQLVSTFKNTPQLPFEDLELHFFGGSRAPLGTPALCGSYTTTAMFTPWSGNPPTDVPSKPFLITSGPGGSPCQDPLPFSPSLQTGSLNLQAGAFTPFTLTMSRPDGNQNLDAIQLKMPPGLLGALSGVKLCGEAEGNLGTCGPKSLIGETTVSVGLGGNPFSVKGGKVYITGPYKGAPYGLSIVNPAKAGPFDVEHDTSNPNYQPACDCVVVRAKIEVDPITAALTVTSDTSGPYAIPQILDGIPLQIQHVNVTINRPNFTFNPTNCSKMAITGGLTSSQGATSARSVPFQVTNCATLGFKPSFKVATSGKTSRRNGASLNVKLAYPKGAFGKDASIAKVKVDLPKQLPSRLTTLQKACADRIFEANPAACPPASHVGTARATTPILPVPLTGPAYFVSHGGAKFPELVIVLSGYGTTVQLHGETFINEKTNVTSSTFRAIPDVPVGSFELKLPQGPDSALAANGNLCKSRLRMPTAFTAQNGMVILQSTRIGVTGCSHAKKARGKARKK